jgi:hypothetical protein
MNPLTDLEEQFNAFACVEMLLVAAIGNGKARDVLHCGIRLTVGRGTGIEDSGDERVIHHRKRLSLDIEPHDLFIFPLRFFYVSRHSIEMSGG